MELGITGRVNRREWEEWKERKYLAYSRTMDENGDIKKYLINITRECIKIVGILENV